MPWAWLKVRLRFDTLMGMYAFDTPEHQYHRQSKFIDDHNITHFQYDRSLRAVFGMLITENITREFNRQTSIFFDVHNEIFYQ